MTQRLTDVLEELGYAAIEAADGIFGLRVWSGPHFDRTRGATVRT